MDNIIDLFTLTSTIGATFVHMELIKTLLMLLAWVVVTMVDFKLIYTINNKFQLLSQNKEENKNQLDKCTLKIFLALLVLLFSVYKILSNSYYLCECFINPDYIYLRHLINLTR